MGQKSLIHYQWAATRKFRTLRAWTQIKPLWRKMHETVEINASTVIWYNVHGYVFVFVSVCLHVYNYSIFFADILNHPEVFIFLLKFVADIFKERFFLWSNETCRWCNVKKGCWLLKRNPVRIRFLIPFYC